RFRAGQRPGVEEYAARHPELANQIRALLPALVMVEEDLSIDRGSGPGGEQPPTEPGHVLATLARSIGSVPGVALPDTDLDQTGATTTNPSPDVMPAPGERGGRSQFFGEIDRSVERSPCARRSDRPKHLRPMLAARRDLVHLSPSTRERVRWVD